MIDKPNLDWDKDIVYKTLVQFYEDMPGLNRNFLRYCTKILNETHGVTAGGRIRWIKLGPYLRDNWDTLVNKYEADAEPDEESKWAEHKKKYDALQSELEYYKLNDDSISVDTVEILWRFQVERVKILLVNKLINEYPLKLAKLEENEVKNVLGELINPLLDELGNLKMDKRTVAKLLKVEEETNEDQ